MPAPSQVRVTKEISRPEILFSVAHDATTGHVYAGASDAQVYAWDLTAEKPEPIALSGHESYVSSLVIAGPRLISGSFDGQLIWWDLGTREAIRKVPAHARWIRKLTVSPDGRRIASVADDMVCRVWDAESGQLIQELKGHAEKTPHHFPSMLYACTISADGRLLATGDRVGHNVIWDLASGKQLGAVETPVMYTWDATQRIHSIGGVRSLAFSPDSKFLAVGGTGKIGNIDHLEALARVEVFDWEKAERTHEFPGDTYKGLTERLQFHPTGQWLLGAGGDHGGYYQFFDLQANKIDKQDKAPMHVHDFVLDAAGQTVYAAGHGRLVVWSLADEPKPDATTSAT